MIEVKNLQKVYQNGDIKVPALKDISLKIEEGEFVAIMGSSGSGKSTFMNILGCLDRLTSGEYLLDGIPIQERNEEELSQIRNLKIGFVFQSFNLIPRTTALKNVELPLLYARKTQSDRREKAMELLEKVGLKDRIYHMPNEMSGGQRQRVAIARALANEPPLILADEPTGNLDSKSGEEVMEIFKKLNDEGVTIIIVTHEPDIAQHCKRIVTFKDGNLISDELVKNRL
ncbi:ABC transporter ATP-binding protein [Tepidibacter formicigenes]|jgi:putative ABC transport system ATP-binding protein|uniref:Putative ABC transport system ATP-binding protein n=1 Tax=Tepidibacter formicigenes DSM 15518 TaxID=1123349 RepID=A0A1M6M2B5_9FIRM|nr:ABC transporter ATP-binding protein [Tepidibacter formicigenes]SHJ77595.1 putative ABC transport system ATP-binding protein [Tepidibacter formicigenes DSM 15518]